MIETFSEIALQRWDWVRCYFLKMKFQAPLQRPSE
jgi:hypothetical protein